MEGSSNLDPSRIVSPSLPDPSSWTPCLSEKLHALFNDNEDDNDDLDHSSGDTTHSDKKATIINLMKGINEKKNYSHYVRPEAGELASPTGWQIIPQAKSS
jgi:hypothetical protein